MSTTSQVWCDVCKARKLEADREHWHRLPAIEFADQCLLPLVQNSSFTQLTERVEDICPVCRLEILGSLARFLTSKEFPLAFAATERVKALANLPVATIIEPHKKRGRPKGKKQI